MMQSEQLLSWKWRTKKLRVETCFLPKTQDSMLSAPHPPPGHPDCQIKFRLLLEKKNFRRNPASISPYWYHIEWCLTIFLLTEKCLIKWIFSLVVWKKILYLTKFKHPALEVCIAMHFTKIWSINCFIIDKEWLNNFASSSVINMFICLWIIIGWHNEKFLKFLL